MIFKNVQIPYITHYFSDHMVSSDEIENRLSTVYKRLKLPQGRLELQTGIKTRSMWPVGTKPSEIATQAAKKCLDKSELDSTSIDLLIHASVCRDFLEPATATVVHGNLKLKDSCIVFDLSNACLGVLSGIVQAACMIESGQIKTAMIVSGENGMPLLEETVNFLNTNTELTRKTIKKYIANLTIGSAGCAVIVSHADISTHGLKLHSGVTLSDTESARLCQGDGNTHGLMMETESEQLLHAGVKLATKTFDVLKSDLQYSNSDFDKVVCHQIGVAHRSLLMKTLDLPVEKDYSTFETYGNTGSAALPTSLSLAIDNEFIIKGDIVALLGIGSGLNSTMLGVEKC
jgi:3-oxoacyl-[acyl-carrier-protein] synthase-3